MTVTMRIVKLAIGVAAASLIVAAAVKKRDSIYENELEQKNPMEKKRVIFVKSENDKENADGVKGHLESVGDDYYVTGIYDKCFKRVIDIILSLFGLIVLSPVFLGFAIAIKIDDPGPVLFTQKRVGRNKQFFKLHKFRSMKMSTPHDVPTHMLDNPEQYITKTGGFARRYSIDELPQIWDVLVGNMSIIGPRPALWNQDVLTAERDKWGANDVKPGLSGWAQINGRDELEIPVKAELDGHYASILKKGGFNALAFDGRCFFRTLFSVVCSDGVVEGGTGKIKKTGKESK